MSNVTAINDEQAMIDAVVAQRDFALELRTQIHKLNDLVRERGGSSEALRIAELANDMEDTGWGYCNQDCAGWMFENVEIFLRKAQGSLSYYVNELEKPLVNKGLSVDTY